MRRREPLVFSPVNALHEIKIDNGTRYVGRDYHWTECCTY